MWHLKTSSEGCNEAYKRKQTKKETSEVVDQNQINFISWIHHLSHSIIVLPDLSEMCIFLIILDFYFPLEWDNLIISILSLGWIFKSLLIHERTCLIYFCCFSGNGAEFTVSEVSMVLSENQFFFLQAIRSLKKLTKLLIIVLRKSLLLLIWRRTDYRN